MSDAPLSTTHTMQPAHGTKTILAWVLFALVLIVYGPLANAKGGRTCPRRASKTLTSYEHGTRGRVGITSNCKLAARNFSYDGKGPSVWWWYSTTGCSPVDFARNGARLSSQQVKRAYRGTSASWPIRSTVDLEDVKCIALYCEEFQAVFGAAAV